MDLKLRTQVHSASQDSKLHTQVDLKLRTQVHSASHTGGFKASHRCIQLRTQVDFKLRTQVDLKLRTQVPWWI